uniref:DUF913 domain-containing protein n=1 Tax=Caenorhabditis japonica TaxID=281687 RepID=A0A8R1EHP3_CAEJA
MGKKKKKKAMKKKKNERRRFKRVYGCMYGGPWEQVQHNGTSCHQQRSGLIKGLLTFIKRAIGDVQLQDVMRHLMGGDLPEALMHILSNAEYYSPSLFHQSAHLITNFVYQFPDELSSLQRRHVPYVIFQSLLRKESPQKTRIRLLTTTVIPAMTYGCETWTSKEADTKRLQRAVSNMFEIAGCDPPDMEKQVLRRKLKWAGHVSRMKYDRWAKIVSEWDPRGSARPRGRPPKRWADDITDSIKIFIHNEALRGNLGHGRRRIGILEAKRAWSTVGRDRVTWRSLVRSIQLVFVELLSKTDGTAHWLFVFLQSPVFWYG